MTARFLHTADWQLGKPYARVDDSHKRSLLQHERILALGRVAEVARAHRASFIVVAGDLFDSPAAARPVVSAGCAAIGAMGLPVYAIPGNHDHGGPGSLWEQPFFRQEWEKLAPNLTVMLDPAPVELESAVLFPCPLLRRHESADSTAWLRSLDFEPFGNKPRVVVAHGGVQGFGPGDDDDDEGGGASNRIDLPRLPESAIDYIALGDWHGMKQVGDRAWYSGTPEPDRFARGAGNAPGHVLAVAAARGAMPEVTPEQTARIGWHEVSFEFADDAGLARLEQEVDRLIGGRVGQDLLRIELGGLLGLDATARLEEMIAAWRARLLRVKLMSRVTIAPSPDEIETLTLQPSNPLISRVATTLVERSRGEGEEAARARIALRELYSLLGNLEPARCD